jgi:hypothetical protein
MHSNMMQVPPGGPPGAGGSMPQAGMGQKTEDVTEDAAAAAAPAPQPLPGAAGEA